MRESLQPAEYHNMMDRLHLRFFHKGAGRQKFDVDTYNKLRVRFVPHSPPFPFTSIPPDPVTAPVGRDLQDKLWEKKVELWRLRNPHKPPPPSL